MPFVVKNYALTADIYLVIFTEKLGPFVRMLKTVLFGWLLLLLLLAFLLLLLYMLLAVKVVEYCEVLY